MTYATQTVPTPPIPVLPYMKCVFFETRSNSTRPDLTRRNSIRPVTPETQRRGNRHVAAAANVASPAAVASRLQRLTPSEQEICVLHLVDGHSQVQVAQWLGVAVRVVREHVKDAVRKVPDLKPLRTRARQKPPHIRIIAFSQLSASDRATY